MTSPARSLLIVSLALLSLPGCAVFKRSGGKGSAPVAVLNELSDLKLEKKLLLQQLDISRREQEALRRQVEQRPAGDADGLARQLEATAGELATLRASYAALDAERQKLPQTRADSAPAERDEVRRQLGETQEKLAVSLRNYTTLQEETARLRQEVATVRTENDKLAQQARAAEASLTQLNTELLAQKQARDRAQQETTALRGQLQAVMGASENKRAPGATLNSLREPANSNFSTTLTVDPARVRAEAAAASGASTNAATDASIATDAAAPKVPRRHVVQDGDTLPKIAEKYYQNAEKWRDIYSANNTILRGDRPLKPGMDLVIP